MIKRPWLGSLSFSLLELSRWESCLRIELRRFTVSFHLPRSVAVSFLHVCLCLCGWESSRVCLTLPRSAQKSVYVFLFLYRDLFRLHFRYFWSAAKWWNATRRNSALGFIAESSWVATSAAVAVAAAQLCGLRCRRQIYVRRVFRMWTANAARKSQNL